LEAIVFRVVDIMDTFSSDIPVNIKTIYADGGVCQNEFVMQFMADMLNKNISVPPIDKSAKYQREMTSFGSAILSALESKFWSLEDVESFTKSYKIYTPNQMSSEERAKKINRWKQAVDRSLDWAF